MKQYTALFVLLAVLCTTDSMAQGKYAGAMKTLIGVTYSDSRNIKPLARWTFRQGSVITPLDNPEMITIDVFQRGTTWIVYASVKEDTASDIYKIVDVLEIKNVQKGWEPKTGLCRQDKVENAQIVAVVKTTYTEFLKQVKLAWRFNPDKRRFEKVPVKGIDCIHEGLS
jgi:hypothetical protein